MSELDHWHPVLRSEELKNKPVAVRVCGREIVVFRTQNGSLGALVDRCPHRAARLSDGRVSGEQLVCVYHGWKWSTDGRGESPGTPSAKPCAEHFDVVERMGAVWIKRAGSSVNFPVFDVNGCFEIGRLRHRVQAPLELVLDNFTEVEHTATTHLLLGYESDAMHRVECRVTSTENSVRTYNIGPQRPLPAPLYTLYKAPRDALFVDDWTTYFSPVYAVYDQYLVDPRTRERAGGVLRAAIFFVPVNAEETELFSFAYSPEPWWDRFGINLLLYPITKAFVDMELRRDAKLLAGLADKNPQIKGNQLGRFDKNLLAQRERLERIYRGNSKKSLSVTAA